jgi:hypothetical protein
MTMMVIWNRRRPSLWGQIGRIVAIVGSAVGLAVGAEMLRRKLGIAVPRIELKRNGRSARMRVSIRTTKGAGRRGRVTVS